MYHLQFWTDNGIADAMGIEILSSGVENYFWVPWGCVQ